MCEEAGRRKALLKLEREVQREVGLYTDIQSHMPKVYQMC